MIYFIQDSLTFRIKIGFTGKDDATERLPELQTGSSSLLYLLATRLGTKQTEKDLHAQFQQYACQGEWFNPGPDLLQYIIGCSAVEMARKAVSAAVSDLGKRSFPDTKAEIARREAHAFLDPLRFGGIRFYLEDDSIKAWPPEALCKADSERLHLLGDGIFDILSAEREEGMGDDPPSSDEIGFRQLWLDILDRLPPVWRPWFEEVSQLSRPDQKTLLLIFSPAKQRTVDLLSDPVRLSKVKGIIASLVGEAWEVKFSVGGKIVERSA